MKLPISRTGSWRLKVFTMGSRTSPQGLSRTNLSIKRIGLSIPFSLCFLMEQLISTSSTTSQGKSIRTTPTPSISTSGRKSKRVKERPLRNKTMKTTKKAMTCKMSSRPRRSRATNRRLKNLNVRISDCEWHSCFCIF